MSGRSRGLAPAEVLALYDASGQGTEPTSGKALQMAVCVPGALQGPQQGQAQRTGVAFSGTSNGYDTTLRTPSATLSLECWFRVAPGQGSFLMGFANTETGNASNWNLILYVDVNGRLRFGVNPGGGAVGAVSSRRRSLQ